MKNDLKSVNYCAFFDSRIYTWMRWGLVALALSAQVSVAQAAPDPQSANIGSDNTVILNAYRDAVYRTPTSEEFEAWQAAVDAGQSEESLFEALRQSHERGRVRHDRRKESRDLLASSIPLVLIYGLAYFLLVRKKPERGLLFAVFVFTFTPLAMNFNYVYQNADYGDFPSFYHGADYIYNQGRPPYGTVLSEEVEEDVTLIIEIKKFTSRRTGYSAS